MEPDGSLPQSQVRATCPYPEPDRSSPYPHIQLPEDVLISSHLRLGLTSGLFPSGFPYKPSYTPLLSPIRTTCPAHLILLDFITRTILGEEYRSLSSSLCSFLHSPVTSSLLSPSILLSTLFSHTLSLRSSLNVTTKCHTKSASYQSYPLEQQCPNTRRQIAVATTFLRLVPNICWSSV